MSEDEEFGIVDINELCMCGGKYIFYMKVDTPNQKGTTAVYECGKCHAAFER